MIKKIHHQGQLFIRLSREISPNRYIIKDITPTELAQIAQVSTRTLQRWIKNGIPKHIEKSLELSVLGFIQDKMFKGFHIADGAIFTPTGERISAGQLKMIAWAFQQSRALKYRVDELRKELTREKETANYWRLQANQIPAANDE